MRIIAGSAGGRKLETPEGQDIRPTTDRVREAVFNALFSRIDIEDTRVVDLFAGTGAYGLEALSRGAAHATFVDTDRRSIDLVRTNIEILGFGDRSTVVLGDGVAWARRSASAAIDVAFCDPPYAFAQWDELLAELTAGLVVIESGRDFVLPEPWIDLRSRRYGSTVVTLSQRETSNRNTTEPDNG